MPAFDVMVRYVYEMDSTIRVEAKDAEEAEAQVLQMIDEGLRPDLRLRRGEHAWEHYNDETEIIAIDDAEDDA
jgi:hypothetical protein